MWKSFESFDKAQAPYVLANVIAADGICFDEQIKDRKLSRCRFYENRDIPYEMRYQNPCMFEQNQWAEKIQSWGPNGTILPWSNASYDWKSTLDEENIGILCFYNEIWFGCYSWTQGSGANYTQNWFDLRFRPREIKKSDLMMILLTQQCHRGCYKENVWNYPCIDPTCTLDKAFLPQFENVKDTDKVELPDGKQISGKDYKATSSKRSDWVEPCTKVCTTAGQPLNFPKMAQEVLTAMQRKMLEVINDFDILIYNLNVNPAGIRELQQLFKADAAILRAYVRENPDFNTLSKLIEDFVEEKLKNLDQFRKRKIAHFYYALVQQLWLWRTRLCKDKKDADFYFDETLLDKLILATRQVVDNVDLNCPYTLQENEYSHTSEQSENSTTDCPDVNATQSTTKDTSPETPNAPTTTEEPTLEDEVLPRSPQTDRMEFS